MIENGGSLITRKLTQPHLPYNLISNMYILLVILCRRSWRNKSAIVINISFFAGKNLYTNELVAIKLVSVVTFKIKWILLWFLSVYPVTQNVPFLLTSRYYELQSWPFQDSFDSSPPLGFPANAWEQLYPVFVTLLGLRLLNGSWRETVWWLSSLQ